MFLTKCTVYKIAVIGTYSNSILGICQVITDFKQVYTCDFARVSTSGFTSRVVTWMQPCTLVAVKRKNWRLVTGDHKKKFMDKLSLINSFSVVMHAFIIHLCNIN